MGYKLRASDVRVTSNSPCVVTEGLMRLGIALVTKIAHKWAPVS